MDFDPQTRRLFTSFRFIGVLIVVATLIGPSHEEAGSFFAEMPKNAPRMGRRSEYVPEKKATRMKYFYAKIPKAMPRIGRRSDKTLEEPSISTLFDDNPIRLSSLLSSLRQSESFDRGGDKCLTMKDLLQIQVFGALLPPKHGMEATMEFKEQSTWPEEELQRSSGYKPRHRFLQPREFYQENED